jgi:hypothetical protein
MSKRKVPLHEWKNTFTVDTVGTVQDSLDIQKDASYTSVHKNERS